MLNLWIKDYHLNISHKIKYITQVSTNPVKFILFANKIKNFPNSYYNYLVNNLRKIGYKNIPIFSRIKGKNKRFKVRYIFLFLIFKSLNLFALE